MSANLEDIRALRRDLEALKQRVAELESKTQPLNVYGGVRQNRSSTDAIPMPIIERLKP